MLPRSHAISFATFTAAVAALTTRLGTTAGAVLFGAAAALGNAQAATMLSSYAEVSAGVNSPDSNVSDSGSTSASANLTSNFGASSYSGTATASSNFGVLKSYVSVDISQYAPESYKTSGANCGGFTFCGAGSDGSTIVPITEPVRAGNIVVDTVTIDDPSRNGTTGYLKLRFDVTGSTAMSYSPGLNDAGPSAQGSLTLFKGVYGVNQSLVQGWGFTGDTTLISPLVSFTYGSPFSLSLTSEVFIDPADVLTSGLTSSDTYDLHGTVDFGHTILLGDFSVFSDAGGATQVGGFAVAAESGTAYATSSPVPVPAALWLFVSGLSALGCAARRRA